jgi:hypothetical protein
VNTVITFSRHGEGRRPETFLPDDAPPLSTARVTDARSAPSALSEQLIDLVVRVSQ